MLCISKAHLHTGCVELETPLSWNNALRGDWELRLIPTNIHLAHSTPQM